MKTLVSISGALVCALLIMSAISCGSESPNNTIANLDTDTKAESSLSKVDQTESSGPTYKTAQERIRNIKALVKFEEEVKKVQPQSQKQRLIWFAFAGAYWTGYCWLVNCKAAIKGAKELPRKLKLSRAIRNVGTNKSINFSSFKLDDLDKIYKKVVKESSSKKGADFFEYHVERNLYSRRYLQQGEYAANSAENAKEFIEAILPVDGKFSRDFPDQYLEELPSGARAFLKQNIDSSEFRKFRDGYRQALTDFEVPENDPRWIKIEKEFEKTLEATPVRRYYTDDMTDISLAYFRSMVDKMDDFYKLNPSEAEVVRFYNIAADYFPRHQIHEFPVKFYYHTYLERLSDSTYRYLSESDNVDSKAVISKLVAMPTAQAESYLGALINKLQKLD